MDKDSENRWTKKTKEYIIQEYQVHDSDEYRKSIQDIVIKLRKKYGDNIVEPGGFSKKYDCVPYHLFFSRIDLSKKTYKQQNSITFPEILDRSLGKIVNSLHLNFKVDITWLCLQYVLAGQRINMTILYGDRVDEAKFDNVTAIQVGKSSNGCHHSKIMILQYSDGIRVVVSTANLFVTAWKNNTHGLWISPHLPPLPKSAQGSNSNKGESPTSFREQLTQYLSKYKNPGLQQWIEVVRKTNFSEVDVFFVASVPGQYQVAQSDSWGHRKLSLILSHHATLPANASKWPIVAQSSSIGSQDWLSKEMVPSMSQTKTQKFQFIHPSLENYKQSYTAFSDFSDSRDMDSKQNWKIQKFMDLYQWKAKKTGRDKAMPYIKSYTRISPDFKSIPWFVLTSANFSEAAWGVTRQTKLVDQNKNQQNQKVSRKTKKKSQKAQSWYCIDNYEAGVVFLPKFITQTTTFPIEDEENPAVPVFPILYDLPLCQYNKLDTPFITRESLHS